MNRIWIGMMTAVLAGLWTAAAGAAPLTLADHGKSAYRIEIPSDAPQSVRLAGRELRDYLKKATGAALAIDNAAAKAAGPLISLGDTPAAKAAGLSADQIQPGGFRIVTRGDDLFILGPDTPDGKVNATGGTSAGTLNGVYGFLENQVGVRWLMPGEQGEYVPKLDSLNIGPMDRTDAPGFARRKLPYVQNELPQVKQWLRRQRQGASIEINHGHNWRHTIPASLYVQHPDWFPEMDGKRPPPVGRYKLETTNPGLVAEYARRAVEAFKNDPNLYCYSHSPSDSGGWSQSKQSKALYETDPNGNLSVTPLVLKFYNAVAAQVRKQMPDKILAGYIYSNYLYPPKEGIGTLEPNLFLVVAPSFDYGYRLYRPDVQKNWLAVMDAWAGHTKQLGYYDLPTNLTPSGVPQPPGIEILQFISPKLASDGVKSIYIYGDAAWGGSAVGNYLKAKLAWNPTADVRKLADDFYHHAYGPQAGAIMERLYDRLDETFKKAYQADPELSYPLTPRTLRALYAGQYAQVEADYLKAAAAATDPDQLWRLEAFGKSLALLQWDLRRAGLIKTDPHSPLYRTDAQIEAMTGDPRGSLAVGKQSFSSGKGVPLPKVSGVKAVAAPAGAPKAEVFQLRGGSRFLLYSPKDEQVTVDFPLMNTYGEVVNYLLRDSLGKNLKHGLISQGASIQFSADGGQTYFLDISAGNAIYQVQVRGCHYAVRNLKAGEGLHLLAKTTPIYFSVSGDQPLTLLLHSASPGETAALDLYSPDGKKAASLETSDQPADQFTSPSGPSNGVWRIDFKKPSSGGVDDVWIKTGGSASPWMGLDPRQLLQSN
jgi:hypothetical protein